MPRPEIHTLDHLLDSARQLVLEGGARAVTIDGLVAASGSPKGSIYHRFATLDDLLATMWLRALRRSQLGFLAALDRLARDPVETAVAAGLSLHDFAAEQPADARLLASMRREDLLGSVSAPEVGEGLRHANVELKRGIDELARALYGRASRSAIERTMLVTVDLPYGAVRRHLGGSGPIPRSVRVQLEAAMRAALAA